MQFVDGQIHLFKPGTEEFAQRMQQALATPEEVIEQMDSAGVSRAYLVPGNAGANAACVDAATRWPDRFRVMAIVGLDKPESRALMENWADSRFHGVRLTFPPYRPVSWLKDGTADWFWPQANRLRLPIMMWAPGQNEAVSEIAAAFPDIRFVMDHMNLFVDDRGDTVARAVEALLPLAARPNIAVKVTALAAHSSEPFPHHDMLRQVERVVGVFGAERAFWGTDITRLATWSADKLERARAYRKTIMMFTEHMPFLSREQLEQVMGAGIACWVGW